MSKTLTVRSLCPWQAGAAFTEKTDFLYHIEQLGRALSMAQRLGGNGRFANTHHLPIGHSEVQGLMEWCLSRYENYEWAQRYFGALVKGYRKLTGRKTPPKWEHKDTLFQAPPKHTYTRSRQGPLEFGPSFTLLIMATPAAATPRRRRPVAA